MDDGQNRPIALVTGVGRTAGIAAGIALRLAHEGGNVATTYWAPYDERMPWGPQPDDPATMGWTLEQVAAQAQVSVGMLSLIETGKRRPSLRSCERIRAALGISEPLPEEMWRQQPREISDELVATLGACLVAPRFHADAEQQRAGQSRGHAMDRSINAIWRRCSLGQRSPLT
jgi:transcriptional regulator with XRE-family HTH domain